MHHRYLTLSVTAAAVLATAACGQPDEQRTEAAGANAPASASAPPTPSASATQTPGPPDVEPVLEGCERYADPDATARAADRPVLDVLADDPSLSWFSGALTGQQSPEVDYRDVLRDGPFTVFAPVDAAIGEQLRQELAADPAALGFFLDYHVVPGRALSPQGLVDAAAETRNCIVPTLQGWELAALAPADGSAPLALSEDTVVPLCGDIATAGARVYLVPELLHPAGDYTIPGSDWGSGGAVAGQ